MVLGSRSKLGVLRQLRGVQVPLSTLEIARRTGLSQPAAAAALRDLARYGLVTSTRVGQARVHVLNRENSYVSKMVEPVFAAEDSIPEGLVESLRAALADRSLSVVLFGSWARGEQGPDSDVDVVVVAWRDADVPELEAHIDDLASVTRKTYGTRLSVLVYSPAEAQGLAERAPALYSEIERDGIVLSGLSAWEWGSLGGA